MTHVALPQADGSLGDYALTGHFDYPARAEPAVSRVAFAALHVVPAASGEALDWDATLKLRQYVWDYGLGVAEAMDTAQRGNGLQWALASELMMRTVQDAKARGARVVCGVQPDPATTVTTLEELSREYSRQAQFVDELGAQAVLMPAAALVHLARGPEDYFDLYSGLIEGLSQPCIIHWLGAEFAPHLRGYWGTTDIGEAGRVVVELARRCATRVDGIKVSTLDPRVERRLRAAAPPGIRIYTGDDIHFPEAMLGDGNTHSDALLGVFGGVAPAAAAALQRLDRGDSDGFQEELTRTVPLAAHIFERPTHLYKAGLAFLAYLNGRQDSFGLIGRLESKRTVVHYGEILRLADQAGLVVDAELTADRMRRFLSSYF